LGLLIHIGIFAQNFLIVGYAYTNLRPFSDIGWHYRFPTGVGTRAPIKEGSKGPIICDFAFLRVVESRGGLPGSDLWLIIRRNVGNPAELKFYFSNAPADIPLLELVRLSGLRWPIEIIFEEGKGELGFAHYETRSWLGWHHHILLVSWPIIFWPT